MELGAASAAAAAPSAGATRPRLMILKMVLENFKSYGGVKEIGPFHKSFSSVVGPNGSGKSNVIDAMLFVFGKRASKMRFNKVSELIHKSAEYPDLDYARVSVFFQEIIDDTASEDAYAVVAGSQFCVTRTAHRNNSSKYYVDAAASSFTEVTALLKARGIDLDNNRFLILQGEVEQIAMMKPKAGGAGEEGLLEYLEDIVGSNAYVPRIAEAEKVVEALTGDRSEKLSRVKVVERERNALEGAKAEAEALLRKEREICRQQGLIAQRTLRDAEAGEEKAAGRYRDLSERLRAAAEAHAAWKASHASLDEGAAAAGKAQEAAAKSARAAGEELAELTRQDVKVAENQRHAVQSYRKLQEAVAREAAAQKEAAATVERLRAALPPMEASLGVLEGERGAEEAAYEGVLAGLQGETEGLRRAMEAKQAELKPVAEAASAATAALQTARTEARLARERLEAGAKATAALEAQAGKVGADMAAKEAELTAARGEHAALAARAPALAAELAAAEASEREAAEAVKAARARAEEGKAALAEGGGRAGSQVETQLAMACRKGGPLAGVGFHGRLGNLGAIDPKYDTAISTACGALNWLVVDSTEGGQACVEYLRKHALGRAKFIILEKIEWVRGRMDAGFSAPEGVPRLFDLVKPKDAALRPAFYFALRETLVAEGMDQAVRIAYEGGRAKHRVVTLNGELIDTSGTMAGGGKTARKGGMAASLSSVAPEEVEAAERDLASATARLGEVRAQRSALASESRELERALPRLSTRVSKLELELASLQRMREDLTARIAAAAAGAGAGASADDKAAAAALQARAVALEKEATRLGEAASALEGEVTALQRQILEAGGERVRRAKARCDRASEAAEEVGKAITKARAELKAAEKGRDKAAKAIEKAVAEGKELAKAVEACAAEKKSIEDTALGVMQRKQAAEGELAAANAELAAIRAQVAGLEKEGRGLREAEAELAAAAEECQVALRSLRKKVETWAGKWAALQADYAGRMAEYAADLAAVEAIDGPAAGEGASATAGEAAEADAGEEGAAAAVSSSSRASRRGAGVGAASTAAAGSGRSPVPGDEPMTLRALAAGEVDGLDLEALHDALEALEAQRAALAKKANLGAIAEFRARDREYLRRVAELDGVTRARDSARREWETLRKRRLDEFMSAFSLISLRLKEMYQMITLGGDAELELVDTCDPFAEGILFQVRPPKKSWKNIANLSGGEKTLSSLALVFALHHYKPTPLYVMDEIDAALDFKNVSIVANYIKERTRDAQFVIISLRNNMFELADRLVGIYKTHDVTKSVTINPKRIAAECAAAASTDAAAADGGAGASEDVAPEGAAAMPGAGKGAAAAGAGAASSTTVGLPLGSRAANLS